MGMLINFWLKIKNEKRKKFERGKIKRKKRKWKKLERKIKYNIKCYFLKINCFNNIKEFF